MGNCLNGENQDDTSLLNEAENLSEDLGNSRITRSNVDQLAYNQESGSSFSLGPQPSRGENAPPISEEEQIKMAKRFGLIQHLPCGIFDGSTKTRECVICMMDFTVNDKVRYLPCMHTYHTDCIDDWLMRSFTCPSCLEPVDAALLNTYETS